MLAGATACRADRVLSPGRSYTLAIVSGDAPRVPAGSLLERGLGVEVRDAAGLPVRGTIVVFRVVQGAANGARVLDSLVVTDDHGEAFADLQMPFVPDSVMVRVFPGGAPERAVSLRALAVGGPVLDGVLPASVAAGDTLALAGSALGGVGATVEFAGSVRVAPVSGGAGELRVVVPDCLAPGPVAIRVQSGTAWTSARTLQYSVRRRAIAPGVMQPMTIGAAELASCVTLATDGNPLYLVIPQLAVQGASPTSQIVRVTQSPAVTGATVVALSPATSLGTAWRGSANAMQGIFDAHLRREEARLAPMARSGSLAVTQPAGALRALALGERRTFQVIADLDGKNYVPATGTLRFLGRHLGIYVDTTTPTAYSDAQLQQLGTLFDNDLYPAAVRAFGAESDIDRNDRVLVFLTPRVNALVASADCFQKGFVTGFFFGRDLLPQASHSNQGEVFYAMVPDATGRFSCSHAPYDVLRLVPGTFIHEFQHMISFFHHVVARAGETEEHWLNEGLSHIAEEMGAKVFEQRYPAPFGRSTTTQLFPDSASPFIAPQMLNAYAYLANSAVHSVTTFEGSGSLEERGGAWLFLRWLGDQKGEAIFQRLVQTSLTGVANVEARAGESLARLFGDFAVAIYTDSVPGLARMPSSSRYRFTSRNLRQLMKREADIAGFPNAFPVTPVRVPYAGYAEGPIVPGTMVYGMLDPFGVGVGPISLSYGRTSGGPWSVTDGAQLGIVRLR